MENPDRMPISSYPPPAGEYPPLGEDTIREIQQRVRAAKQAQEMSSPKVLATLSRGTQSSEK